MGGKIVSEESRGTKSVNLFYTLCYQNQVNVRPEKLNFLVCHKDQGGAQSNFQETSLLTRKNRKIEGKNIFPGVAKRWCPLSRGGSCHPMATGLLLWKVLQLSHTTTKSQSWKLICLQWAK